MSNLVLTREVLKLTVGEKDPENEVPITFQDTQYDEDMLFHINKPQAEQLIKFLKTQFEL